VTDAVDLSPTRFAALVAPAVSRAFVAGMQAGGDAGRELVRKYGGTAIGYLIDLRNPLAAGRPITADGLAAVYRYDNPDERDNTVRRSVAHGLLDRAADGTITATARGQEFLHDLFAVHAKALSPRWEARHGATVERLNALADRVLTAAAATAGPAWAVQAPPHEPAGTPPGVLLLNRLATLRVHRADAHAAAWQAAGMTAAEMAAMPWGTPWSPERTAVEADTNVRAGAPYAVLTPDGRLALLADLAALP
jgi:hypothetical protein